MAKLISLENLTKVIDWIKNNFVRRELKTGSKDQYKTLSDNNLTDAMVAQISQAASKTVSVTRYAAVDLLSSEAKIDPASLKPAGGQVGDLIIDAHYDAYNVTAVAGDGTLTVGNAIGKNGAYAWGDINNQPTIAGHALAAGDNTLASLGIEAAGAAAAARTGAVDDVKKLGYQTADQVNAAITGKGYETAANVDKKVADAKTDLQGQITAAVTSVYKPKGSTAFAGLPADNRRVGDVWNISDAFTTTDDFIEGAGHAYPAGTNVVLVEVAAGEGGNAATTQKWDVFSGVIDLSGYLLKTDLQVATGAEIDALFA